MRSFRLWVLVIASCVLISFSAGIVTAQAKRMPVRIGFRPSPLRFVQAQVQVREQAWQAVEDRLDHDPRAQAWGRPVLRVGQDLAIKSTDTVRDAAVIFGSATIDGFVEGDVFVWLGNARLSDTAVIRGSLVVVGGNVTVASGAVVRHDLVVIGGTTDAAVGFLPGGDHVSLGAQTLGDRIRQVVPWVTRGLLLGRPIVPDLAWVWWIASLFFIVYFLVNLVFHDPVRVSAQTLAARPFSAFLTGLLVLLLAGPLSLLLVISVIGVLVVPFALCAVVVAGVVGRVAVARMIGNSVVRQSEADNRPQSMRSFLIGSAVILLLYIIPVVGLMTWALVGVFGLGSAVLAFFSAIRRENPAPPKRVVNAPASASGFGEASPAPSGHGADSTNASTPNPSNPVNPVNPVTPMTPVNPASIPDLTAFPRAYFSDRLAAFALDLLLVYIVAVLFGPYRRDEERYLFLVLAYYVGLWTWKGTTVGGIICNLRVVREDGAPLRFVDAAVRGLSGVFSILALGLGGLWILRDPERQAWHDKISATYVVKVPRNYPLP